MDFLLPDEDTMALMCEEYERTGTGDMARAFALNLAKENDFDRNGVSLSIDDTVNASAPIINIKYILLLYLYFGVNLRYNGRYGTSIHDTNGGMGGLRPVSHTFGKLNNLR